MRGLLRAVGAVLRAIGKATRTVVVFCGRTGKLVVRTVMAPLAAIGSGGMAEPMENHPGSTKVNEEVAPSQTAEHLERIKKLAIGLAAGVAPAALFEGIPDNAIEWLTVMDRQMLYRVACAKDGDLAAHLAGKVSLKQVLVYDQRAVSDYRAQTIGAAPDPEEPEPEIKPALAA
jgi:hypothetical protein